MNRCGNFQASDILQIKHLTEDKISDDSSRDSMEEVISNSLAIGMREGGALYLLAHAKAFVDGLRLGNRIDSNMAIYCKVC
jgi:hypothetical protein